MKPSQHGSDFTYVCEYFSKELDITFPLSPFECRMLTTMNVAPSQLHPNSWAFLKAFPILCHKLHIESTINVLMYFYQLKHTPFSLSIHLLLITSKIDFSS